SNSIDSKSVVTFTTQAEPLKTYTAYFARSANSLQETNRSMIIEFDYPNMNGDLKAGMYAEVLIPIVRSKPSLFVPKSSVLRSTEGIFVVKVNNNMTEWIGIQQGHALDSLVEVFGPVKEGDKVVRTVHDEMRN